MNIHDIVIDAVREVAEDQDNDLLNNPTINTKLFGVNLDSMGIVFLVSELEERISGELEVDIVLADERAMSQKTSPFRSIKTLVEYIQVLVDETKESE